MTTGSNGFGRNNLETIKGDAEDNVGKCTKILPQFFFFKKLNVYLEENL